MSRRLPVFSNRVAVTNSPASHYENISRFRGCRSHANGPGADTRLSRESMAGRTRAGTKGGRPSAGEPREDLSGADGQGAASCRIGRIGCGGRVCARIVQGVRTGCAYREFRSADSLSGFALSRTGKPGEVQGGAQGAVDRPGFVFFKRE